MTPSHPHHSHPHLRLGPNLAKQRCHHFWHSCWPWPFSPTPPPPTSLIFNSATASAGICLVFTIEQSRASVPVHWATRIVLVLTAIATKTTRALVKNSNDPPSNPGTILISGVAPVAMLHTQVSIPLKSVCKATQPMHKSTPLPGNKHIPTSGPSFTAANAPPVHGPRTCKCCTTLDTSSLPK